jgi:hypothetical protein
MMVDGTTDEFFPLSAFQATYDAVPGPDKRLSLAANFDHGCYQLTAAVEDKAVIEDRAALHARGAQRLWLGHWLGTTDKFPSIPSPPTAQLATQGAVSLVAAVVDETGYDVEEVRAWASSDDAYTFLSAPMKKSSGVWSTDLLPAFPPNAVWFVDAQYRTKDLIAPDRFTLSSPPAIPAGHVPHVRGIDDCL